MKQVLSENYAIVDSVILDHHTTVFTNDNISVQTFATLELLNYQIANMNPATLPLLPAVGQQCLINALYQYGSLIAKCVQSHTRMSFPPEQTPALFTVITPVVGYPVWVQPTGAHDAYKIGDRVHFPLISSPVYESKINANVWSPTAYPAGWQLIP